jgi:hypothetical protein
MRVSKSKSWKWWKWVAFAYNLGQKKMIFFAYNMEQREYVSSAKFLTTFSKN